jgi:hypothetical protein
MAKHQSQELDSWVNCIDNQFRKLTCDLKPPKYVSRNLITPLNAELNPIRYLLALLEAHHFLHVSRIRVKSLTPRLLMSYIYIYIYIYIYDISNIRVNTSAHCSGRKQVKG